MGEANKSDVSKELKNAISQIEKQFGDGAIMKLGDRANVPIEGISTGSLSLDMALGGRGVPRGRVIEVFGPEASGKTTVALHCVANAQKAGGVAAFIDAEHALDPSWAKRLGVNLEDLLVSQPDSGEQALKIAEMLVKSNAVDIIVIDSVAALVPRAEVEGEIGDTHVGLQARLMSQALRILTPTVSKTKTTMIFINQLREKIGAMTYNPETTPGGRALKFYASVRMDVRRIGQVKEGDEVVGSEVKVKVVKNKIAPPFRQCEFEILNDRGISAEGDLVNMALEDKIIEKSGAWFNYGETRLGQGKLKAMAYLRDNPALTEEIKGKILLKRVPPPPSDAPAAAPEPEEAPAPAPTGGRKRQAAASAGE